MSIDSDIKILEQVPMLRVLGRGTLRVIAMGAETKNVAQGDMLFQPQEKPDCAYVVQEGSFYLSANPELTGKRVEVGPGTLLGEFALLSEAARPLTAVAREPSVVMRISRSMFLKLLEDDVHAAMRLRDYVAQRTRQAVADMLAVRDALDPQKQGN